MSVSQRKAEERRYRRLSREMRSLALGARDDKARAALDGIADRYDRLADRAAELARFAAAPP
jgi:hypothetical protein